MGYSPWGHKESDTIEQVHLYHLNLGNILQHMSIYPCISLEIWSYICPLFMASLSYSKCVILKISPLVNL